MITLGYSDAEEAFIFEGELPQDAEAYVDADWLAGSSGAPVPAIFARAGRLESSWDDRSVSAVGKTGSDAALAALAGVASAAARAAAGVSPVAVRGTGLVARIVRDLLGDELEREDGRQPITIVETRSEPTALLDSARRVADLGTIVLAIQPAGEVLYDLYPDVHVRALRVVAVPFPLDVPAATHPLAPEPKRVRLGEALAADASWYLLGS
ncbi:MAG TPA: hypothetical protein VG265_16215 [Gaiellaceae bacterium]|nr:hypothetical protein [Gaiellaceae bacterium]